MKVVIKIQAMPDCIYVTRHESINYDVDPRINAHLHHCSQAIKHDRDYSMSVARRGGVTLCPASDRVVGRKEVR